MKPQLHLTGLEMLWRCGIQFYRRYVELEIIPPGVAMLVGTATDKSVTANLTEKIERGVLLDIESAADVARDALNTAWEKGVRLDDDEQGKGEKMVRGEAIDKAVRLAKLHAEKKAPTLNPTDVQRRWVLEIPDQPLDLAGTLDIQEGSYSVRDTKTMAKRKPPSWADDNDQLTMYALAVQVLDGKAPDFVVLDCLIDQKTLICESLVSTRSREDFHILLARVSNAIEVIQKGAFTPTSQTNWWCSPKWCGYYTTCPYAKQRVVVGVDGLRR